MNTEILSYLRLSPLPRKTWVGLGVTAAFLALTEGAGMGLLMPVLLYVERGAQGLAESGGGILVRVLEHLHLPVDLAVLLAVALVPFLLRQLVSYLQQVYLGDAQYTAEALIRGELVRAYMKAPLSFFSASNPGTLVSDLLQEAGRYGMIVWATTQVVTSVFLLLVYVAILLWISPRLTLLALPLFFVSSFFMRRFLRRSQELGREVSASTSNLSRTMTEVFMALRLIRMRAMTDEMSERLVGDVRQIRASLLETKRVQAMVESASQPIFLTGVFILFYSAISIFSMTLASLGMYMFIMLRVVPLLVNINSRRLQIRGVVEGARQVRATMQRATHGVVDHHGTMPFQTLANAITFDAVSFSYQRDGHSREVLKNVDLTIRAGETLALVGPSGAGKSTIVDLVARFIEPTDGRILVDGHPLAEYDLNSFRTRIGLVTQDAVMFNDTIRFNITFGQTEHGDEDTLWRALEQAHIADFVRSLPLGLDTVLGDRGTRLSGGQRQRLALARALHARPEILILDEPTSALDSISEQEIQASLQALHGRITMLVIAHRLSTIKHADRILVMSDRRIVDQGSHDELLARGGLYFELFERQQAMGDPATRDAPASIERAAKPPQAAPGEGLVSF